MNTDRFVESHQSFSVELKRLYEWITLCFNQEFSKRGFNKDAEELENSVAFIKDLMSKCPEGMDEKEFYDTVLTQEERDKFNELRMSLSNFYIVQSEYVDLIRQRAAAVGIVTDVLELPNDAEMQKKLIDNGESPQSVIGKNFLAITCSYANEERLAEVVKDCMDSIPELSEMAVIKRALNIEVTRTKEGFGAVSENLFNEKFPINEKERVIIGGTAIDGEAVGLNFAEVKSLSQICARNKISFYYKKIPDSEKYQIITIRDKEAQMHGLVDATLVDCSGTLGKVNASREFEALTQMKNLNDAIKERQSFVIANFSRTTCIKVDIDKNTGAMKASYCKTDPATGKIKKDDRGKDVIIESSASSAADVRNKIEEWATQMNFDKVAIMTPEEHGVGLKDGISMEDFSNVFVKKNHCMGFDFSDKDIVNAISDEMIMHYELLPAFTKLYTLDNCKALPERLKDMIGLGLRRAVLQGFADDFEHMSNTVKQMELKEGHPFNFDVPATEEDTRAYVEAAEKEFNIALSDFMKDFASGDPSVDQTVANKISRLCNNRNYNLVYKTSIAISSALSRKEKINDVVKHQNSKGILEELIREQSPQSKETQKENDISSIYK